MSATHLFTCASGSGNLLRLTFFGASNFNGTLEFSHPSGSISYTNPDGEELTFPKAKGTFKMLLGGTNKSIDISWKPLGKKRVRGVGELIYGEGEGEAEGSYECSGAEWDSDEEE